MTQNSLRIGVVGAGVFGGYHAGKCAAHPRLDFIGVYDADTQRAQALAGKFSVRAYKSLSALLGDIDALIIAAPAAHHGAIAKAALRAGCHVLIEKPLATDLGDATEILRLAADQNLVLQVGHQERLVGMAIGLDKAPQTPLSIRASRFTGPSARNTDVSVTLDLMTHDLDMALWLLGEMPSALTGHTQTVYSGQPDAAMADLVFPSGARVHLEASRVEDRGQRIMHICYPKGDLTIDFNAKTLVNSTPFDFDAGFGQNPLAADSLGAATNAFVASILDGAPIVVTGQAGYNAMTLALKIDSAKNRG